MGCLWIGHVWYPRDFSSKLHCSILGHSIYSQYPIQPQGTCLAGWGGSTEFDLSTTRPTESCSSQFRPTETLALYVFFIIVMYYVFRTSIYKISSLDLIFDPIRSQRYSVKIQTNETTDNAKILLLLLDVSAKAISLQEN